MDRPTKKINISSGEVVLKEWITGRESEFIGEPMNLLKLQYSQDGGRVTKIGGEMEVGKAKQESIHRAISSVVISVNGKVENVLDLVLDLPKKDYELVIKEVDKVITGENFT